MITCQRPIYLESSLPRYDKKLKKHVYNFPASCRRCYPCMQRNINQWSFRMLEEKKQSNSIHFVTLTYNTKYIPIIQSSCGRYHTTNLDKGHLTNFLKRLREKTRRNKNWDNPYWVEGKPLKYYACGEYGAKTKRSHYHLILFNTTRELIEESWRNYVNPETGEVIDYGHCDIQIPRKGAIGYVMKYVSKVSKRPYPEHLFPDLQPEFNVTSTGIGKSYLTDSVIEWHRKGNYFVYNEETKQKIAIPEYYRKKIWQPHEMLIAQMEQSEVMEEIIEQKKFKWQERNKKSINKYSWEEYLEQLENVYKERRKRLVEARIKI